jgi:hypothetical protein
MQKGSSQLRTNQIVYMPLTLQTHLYAQGVLTITDESNFRILLPVEMLQVYKNVIKLCGQIQNVMLRYK